VDLQKSKDLNALPWGSPRPTIPLELYSLNHEYINNQRIYVNSYWHYIYYLLQSYRKNSHLGKMIYFGNDNNELIMSMRVREDKYHLHEHPSMSF